MLQDLIIIIGIIFFVYKLITHEGKLSLARIVAMLGMSIWLGVGLLHEVVSIFVLFFLSLIVMGISLIGMYFIPSSENYDETKAQKYQKLYKGALYSWLFMVALYIFLYVLTYY